MAGTICRRAVAGQPRTPWAWVRATTSSAVGERIAVWRDAGMQRGSEQVAALHDKIKQLVPHALEHTGAKAFDHHLMGVQAILRAWVPADDALANAGLFHSIYGTEGFQGFALPFDQRAAIRDLIGTRAERLAWLFCVLDRETFDHGVLGSDDLCAPSVSSPGEPRRLQARARPELGCFDLGLTEDEFLDMCTLVLADYLEQVEGVSQKSVPNYGWRPGEGWAYRRFAYKAMAQIVARERGLTVALEAYEHVYELEPPPSRARCIPTLEPITDAARTARMCLASRALDQTNP